MRPFISASDTFMGTPAWLYMSVCIHMTSGKQVLAVPMGWCATSAEMFLPFSLSLSASMTSPVPMSTPHMKHSASCSIASSGQYEKRESAYGFQRRSMSYRSFLSSSSFSYASLASSRTF